jgi:hypothetical protein
MRELQVLSELEKAVRKVLRDFLVFIVSGSIPGATRFSA